MASRPFLVSPCFRFETCVILYHRYESTVNQVERASEGPNNLSLESRSIARGQIRDSEVVLRGSFARVARARLHNVYKREQKRSGSRNCGT